MEASHASAALGAGSAVARLTVDGHATPSCLEITRGLGGVVTLLLGFVGFA